MACVSRSIQNINSVQLLIELFYQEQILYNTLPKNHNNLRIILEGQGDYVVTLRVNSTPVNPIPTNPLRISEKTSVLTKFFVLVSCPIVDVAFLCKVVYRSSLHQTQNYENMLLSNVL